MWKVSYLQGVNFPPKLSSTSPSGIAFFTWHKPILSERLEIRRWILKQNLDTKKVTMQLINLINNWKLILLNIKEMLVLKLRKFGIHLSGKPGGMGNFIHLSYNTRIEKNFINRLSLYSKLLLLKCLTWSNHNSATNLLFFNKNMWIKTKVIWNRALLND